MILLDTSGLLAALVASQRAHRASRSALESDGGPLVLSPFVLAELDYLLTKTVGAATALAFLREVASGIYELATFDSKDVAAAIGVMARYEDLGVGLADASIVVLAERLRTDRILTLDERHFRALRTPGGGSFTLLPADA